MPLPFPELKEKCETHVCLIANEHGDERWEDVFGMSRDEKDRKCRNGSTTLETLYHQESDKARLNSLGGYIGTIKMNTKRFGVERRKCAIDSRGIFVAMDPAMKRIITSFRPILDPSQPPQNHGQFKREALTYYRRYSEKPWGQ